MLTGNWEGILNFVLLLPIRRAVLWFVFSKPSDQLKDSLAYTKAKGYLISEWNFGVFKSPKKPTKFITDLSPSFIGQKSV